MADSIEIRAYREQDQVQALQLLRASLGEKSSQHRSEDWWRWKHERSPFGTSLRLCAWHGDRLVGLRAFMPWVFSCDGQNFMVARAVDTATHPDYQGKGIFKRLTLAALEEAKGRGWQLVLNTPNKNSLPGYLKMDWQQGEPLILHVLPVKFFRTIWRVLKSDNARRLPEALPGKAAPSWWAENESSWPSNMALGDKPRTALTREYFAWRYCQNPHHQYHVVESRKQGRRLIAVFRVNVRAGAIEVILCDLVGVNSMADLRTLLKPIRRCREVDFVLAHFPPGGFLDRASWRGGFLTGQPLRMNFTTRRLVGDNEPFRNPSAWHLSLGDIELF